MIRVIAHAVSDGLRRENEFHQRTASRPSLEELRQRYPTAQAFCREFLASAEGMQFARAVEALPAGARVLDVGVGLGETSIHLAAAGHRVTAVEPSLELCEFIDRVAQLHDLPLEVCCVTAEAGARLPGGPFDACIFNASLHHCDDPDRALANCHQLLRPGGRLFLLNEPHLQLFRSKKWFYHRLEQHPSEIGHYGGNEHTYYYHEYRAMLRRAGFRDVRDQLALRYLRPDSYLNRLESWQAGKARLLARRLYYGAIAGLARSGAVGKPALSALKRLSLLQTNFTARKPA